MARCLFQYVNIVVFTDLMKLRRPHGRADFTEMCFPEQQHLNARLAYTTADRQRNLVVEDHLVIRLRHFVFSRSNRHLFLERFRSHPDTHRGEFVPSFGQVVVHQDVAIQAVH